MESNPQHPQPLEGNDRQTQNSAWLSPTRNIQYNNETNWLSPLRDVQFSQTSAHRTMSDPDDNPITRINSDLFSKRATNTSENADSSRSAGHQDQNIPTINENYTWPPLLASGEQPPTNRTSRLTETSWPTQHYENREQTTRTTEKTAGEHSNSSTNPETTQGATTLGPLPQENHTIQ